MDPAVGLVQSYLRMNGYFTETEYPIIALKHGNPVTLTDLDVLAIRFPAASRWIPGLHKGSTILEDPTLDIATDRMDMIIAEVKEGKASLNPAARTRDVLETVLHRFGCCGHDPSPAVTEILQGHKHDMSLSTGLACRLRIVVFSGAPAPPDSDFQTISLRHAASYVCRVLREHDGLLSHTQFKDETLGLLTLLHKLGLNFQN